MNHNDEDTMNLTDLIGRAPQPKPWAEGDNIPWHDPDFSRRMLREHLSQEHDLASRRTELVDRQTAWIHEVLLGRKPSRVLDLCCGPGLYLNRLAHRGHTGLGIDYSPASVEHAAREAEAAKLDMSFVCEDLREATFGDGYDLAMMIYGEFNVFKPAHIERILKRAVAALKPGGTLLIEPHRFEFLKQNGANGPSWYSTESGLFSDQPHFCLQENFWDDGANAATTRFHIVDAATAAVTSYAASYQAYTDESYRRLLEGHGLTDIRECESLTGASADRSEALTVYVASRSKQR